MFELFNEPVAFAPDALPGILALAAKERSEPMAIFGDTDRATGIGAGYDLVDGIAVIPIAGMLVKATGYAMPIGWLDWKMTGYDGIRFNLRHALQNASVKAILLAIDSPGGVCAHMMDLGDEIFAARKVKKVWSVAAETACSAAYLMFSAAERGYLSRTGVVGSIGAVHPVLDMSRALDQSGVTVNLIHYGERKVDGYPELPLSRQARARFQADINTLGELFTVAVARNRGLTPDAVRATEADTYMGDAAVSAGLADIVAPCGQAFADLLAAIS